MAQCKGCVKSKCVALAAAVSLFLTPAGLPAQSSPQDSSRQIEQIHNLVDPSLYWLRLQKRPRTPAPNYVSKRPGHYSPADWATAIDTTWGMGLTGAQKASVFLQVWDTWNMYAACFTDRDTTYWDSIKAVYDACDFDTVSRGQFCGLMQYVTGAIQDGHSSAMDDGVVLSQLAPGIPLAWKFPGPEGHFGAGLTPLADSTLLVYKTVASHPLGLVRGDVVLGYDGLPWTQLFREILAVEMPVYGVPAANATTDIHLWMNMAGMNWHLFDTMDVVKHATGDTVHLPTDLLTDASMDLWASEQLEMPNIPLPDFFAGECVTWGMLEGTSIGYVYHAGFEVGAEAQWDAAIRALMFDSMTTGLIVDVRLNYGGWVIQIPPFSHLFDSVFTYIRWHQRCASGGRWDMCPDPGLDLYYTISGHPTSFYDKPVALLTGPNTVSCGDVFSLALSQHPMTKVFGKPTNGAFNVLTSDHDPSISGWYCRLADRNSFLIADSTEYLTRKAFPDPLYYPEVDYEEVWLTQEGVAQGRDDVVEAAKAWIFSRDLDQDGVVNENDNCLHVANPDQGETIILTGDVNIDGSITSSDIIYMVNYTFKGGFAPLPCEGAGDANCDGSVTAADVIALVNYVFKSGDAPCDVCLAEGLGWTCP